MPLANLLKGLFIGIAIAAPVGPIGILCIQRSLAGGRLHGLVSGLGAASADAVYGSVAAFGLTFVSTLLSQQQAWIRLLGGLFLCVLGIRTFRRKPDAQPSAAQTAGNLTAYASTFFLTLTNPLTILSFAAVFAGLGLSSGNPHYAAAVFLVLGVFLGSAIWWLFLSTTAGTIRKKIEANLLAWINRISGFIILGFGVFALAGLIL